VTTTTGKGIISDFVLHCSEFFLSTWGSRGGRYTRFLFRRVKKIVHILIISSKRELWRRFDLASVVHVVHGMGNELFLFFRCRFRAFHLFLFPRN
jgi:hypothetical protein